MKGAGLQSAIGEDAAAAVGCQAAGLIQAGAVALAVTPRRKGLRAVGFASRVETRAALAVARPRSAPAKVLALTAHGIAKELGFLQLIGTATGSSPAVVAGIWVVIATKIEIAGGQGEGKDE